jgi:pimeloyl-[acyl-carrier protein] methyl ester esterase
MIAGARMINRLVLLPGMHGTGELFSEFMKMISEPKHIEAISYPTDASLSYQQLMRAVHSFVPASDPYFLLAESFSTPLAIQFAATKPTNLKGLILCAGFATSPLNGPRRFVASLLAPLLFHLPVFGFPMNHFLIGPNAPPPLQAAVQAAVSSVMPNVLAERLRAVLSCDARQALSEVAVPILYIQATNDRVIPKSCLDEIRRIKPDLRVAEIDGPHLILQREPNRSADIVSKFVEEFQ